MRRSGKSVGLGHHDQVRPILMGNGAGAPRMHSMMHLSLVRYTPIFCQPYTRRADRQPCARSRHAAFFIVATMW
jgi:hypothetical protein